MSGPGTHDPRKRILFVDDEPLILNGLKRLLHPLRNEWSVGFASGGEAAVAVLESERVDVLVTDIRMPGMDGHALLRYAREHFPGTIRIVLSGQTELEVALRSLPLAHQFVSKPCSPQILKNVVDRASRLSEFLENAPLQRFVGTLSGLPSIPQVYADLIQLLAKPESTVREISELIQSDLALCAKVLQLINSAFFSLPREVTTIEHAVSYLGSNLVKNLVLSFEVQRWLDDVDCPPGFSPERIQRRSLLAAKISSELMTDKLQKDEAFTGTMLADIGQLVLATTVPGQYARLLSDSHSSGRPLQRVELDEWGVHHGQIGAYLIGLWGLPYTIVEAVAFHHKPSESLSREFDVLAGVHIADQLANQVLQDAEPDDGWSTPRFDTEYLRRIGLAEKIPAWARQARGLLEAKTRAS